MQEAQSNRFGVSRTDCISQRAIQTNILNSSADRPARIDGLPARHSTGASVSDLKNMTIESSISTAIENAIEKLKINDRVLLDKKMEWATAHRLALYLEEYFPGWDIDCEYNKMGHGLDTKHNSHGKYKRPDIVIHKRERFEKENNLLVIEIKMNSSDDEDENKLIDLTSPPNESRPFQYQNGLKISFFPKLYFKWFKGGQEIV